MSRKAGILLLLAGCGSEDAAGFPEAPPAQPLPSSFTSGDVFVSLASGAVEWHRADGTLVRTLTGDVPGLADGMAFDAAGNLYVTHWCAESTCVQGNTIERISRGGTPLGPFGQGYDCNPTSIDFDAEGDVYLGQSDCGARILRFDPSGSLREAMPVEADERGSSWIDLAADGCTIVYTSHSRTLLRYDACRGRQLDDFGELPDVASALRLLGDGGAVVAATSAIAVVDATGSETRSYSLPGEPALWHGIDTTSDGTLWAGNYGSGTLVRIDVATGGVITKFTAGTASLEVKGVSVFANPPLVDHGGMSGAGSVLDGDEATAASWLFELPCDTDERPATLAITHGAHSFVLEELTLAVCTDDPAIAETGLDSYEGRGTGTLDGAPGASAEWIFTDGGESDRLLCLLLRDAAGEPIVTVKAPGHSLATGNHQAKK